MYHSSTHEHGLTHTLTSDITTNNNLTTYIMCKQLRGRLNYIFKKRETLAAVM